MFRVIDIDVMNVIYFKVEELDKQISSRNLRALDCAGKPASTLLIPL